MSSTSARGRFQAEYELGPVLNSGAFATVHACTRRSTGERCAVKIINVAAVVANNKELGCDADPLRDLAREVDAMRLLSGCPYAVHMRDVYMLGGQGAVGAVTGDDGEVLVVEDLMQGGDLREFLTDTQGTPPEARVRQARVVLRRILSALHALHGWNMLHRDEKIENGNSEHCGVGEI